MRNAVRSFVRSAVLIFFDDRPPDARKVIKVTAALTFPDFLAEVATDSYGVALRMGDCD